MVIKDVQGEILSSEKYAQLQKSLKSFCDENKILRCGGRLSYAPLEYGAKFPIILPGSHVTKLIVRKCHETVGRNGVKDTLTQLRDKYWLVNPISTGGGVFHPMPSEWLRTPQRSKLAP